jgi:hypothetical protein
MAYKGSRVKFPRLYRHEDDLATKTLPGAASLSRIASAMLTRGNMSQLRRPAC